ncbi:M36 family metallopeptidase, partial [Conexibacter stalactiti]
PLADAAVPSTTPRLAAPAAVARVRRDAGASAGGDARLVIFAADDGARLAWTVRADADSTHRYAYVIDANTGAILKRSNLVRAASGEATSVWSYAPSDDTLTNPRFQVGNDGEGGWRGIPRVFRDGWITAPHGSRLQGENAHVFSDVDDDDRDDTLEEVAANAFLPDADETPVWDYPFRRVPGWDYCTVMYPCSWTALYEQTPTLGWKQNREQNAVQVFWFLNTFKEHLEAAPIGFDASWGNFSGDDYVIGQANDGADGSILVRYSDGRLATIDHHPDLDHLDNANMYTPPDGESPTMQMYLFIGARRGGMPDANGGDDASIVFHEYTHGLSSRLITDDSGVQALNAPQAGAMGEAWSDWYAMDYLAGEGWQVDTSAEGEVLLSSYISGGTTGALREAAMDCPVGSGDAACAGGGFTYADYGKVLDGYGPEVHADGEIWGQTLWDLRTALVDAAVTGGGTPADGIATARLLVTEGMRLAPPEPSFLDMRDAILAANVADESADEPTRAARRELLWEVFAGRGMGYYAETYDGWDPAPVADFDLPPDESGGPALLSGTVTDTGTGLPLAGATVRLPGPGAPSDETDADGRYEIPNAWAGADYPRLIAERNGYQRATVDPPAIAPDGSTVQDLELRRNWALTSGGGVVDSATGPDLTAMQCGPVHALDGTSAYGWGSYQPGYDGSLHEQYGLPRVARGSRRLVLRLPAAVDVSRFAIDPGAICGDDDSASLAGFQIETSADGTTWRNALAATFGRAHNHRLNELSPNAGTTAGVRWVRLTMLSAQGGGSSGTYFMDMAELAVFGTATRPVDPPDPPDPPDDPDPDPPDDPDPDPPVTPVTPPSEPPPAPPAPPADQTPRGGDAPPSADADKPKLEQAAVVLPKKRSLATLLGRKGLPLKLRADKRVKVIATITLTAPTARKLRLTRQRNGVVAIARLSNATVKANRATTLRVKVPRNTVVWLERLKLRKLDFGVAILATDAQGNVTSRILKATAKR